MTTLNMDDFYKTNPDGNIMMTLAKPGTSMDGHNSVTRDGLFMATEAMVGQSAIMNDTEEARKEMDRKDMEKEEAEREERFMNMFNGGKGYGWVELGELWDETERKETERKEAEKKGLGRKERKKMKRKEQLERKESERKETERKETERKETERKESERMEMERKEKERKEKERKEIKRKEMERKETERKEIERKESERIEMERKEKNRKETERKESERMEMERKEKERKEIVRKEMERKELERKEIERRDSERMEMVRKGKERKETERKESERMEMERKERERKETERKEMERKESERKEIERKESERMEIERKEKERKETERKETERKESERKEMERQELVIQFQEAKGEIARLKGVIKRMCSKRSLADGRWEWKEGMESERKEKVLERKEISLILRKSTPPSSVTSRVRDMFAALGAGKKEGKTKGSNEGRKREGCNGEDRMKRMEEDMEKELGKKETLVVLDREGKKKVGSYGKDQMKRMEEEKRIEIVKKETLEVLDKDGIYERKTEGNRVGSKKTWNRKEKGSSREETLEILRRRNNELVVQFREVMEENALLYESIRKKTPGMSSFPRLRKLVKEIMMEVAHEDVDGFVDLPRGEDLSPPLPPLPPWDGGTQDGSKKKVGSCIVNDAQVTLPVKEARTEKECRIEEVESSAMSELKVADWRVVARRSWCRGRVEDVQFPPPPPSSPRKRELLVVGLEESAAPCKIMEALCGIGSCPKEDIRMGPIRTRNNGPGTAWVQLPVAAALKAAKEGRVRVGRTTARVELLKVRPLQCFKCWKYGHVQYTCHSEVDRRGKCFKCGQMGHVANTCHNAAHCALCHDAGWKATHRLGGFYCMAVVQQQGTLLANGMEGRHQR